MKLGQHQRLQHQRGNAREVLSPQPKLTKDVLHCLLAVSLTLSGSLRHHQASIFCLEPSWLLDGVLPHCYPALITFNPST